MEVKIRFRKDHSMEIDGRVRQFTANEEIEIDQDQAVGLIRDGVALPGGVQHGKPVRQTWE